MSHPVEVRVFEFSLTSTLKLRNVESAVAAKNLILRLVGIDFVTRKISRGVALIYHGKQTPIKLGNLDAQRDWGHARDYMQGVYTMMHYHVPDDYVLATGESRSVRQFAVAAFQVVGITLM